MSLITSSMRTISSSNALWCFACLGLFTTTALVGCGYSESAPATNGASSKSPKYDVQVATANSSVSPVAEPADESGQSPPAVVPDAAPQAGERQEPVSLPNSNGAIPLNDPDAAELTMPKVVLTEAQAQACRARMGADFPDIQLPDLAGQEQSLHKLFGPKLTVIAVWSGTKPSAREELADLGPTVLDRFSGNGVAVAGINTLDDPQLARELVQQSGARFPNLSDRNGTALEGMAGGKVPCTFLVDATGKILWFDIEYSRTTRRDLVEAIRYTLTRP